MTYEGQSEGLARKISQYVVPTNNITFSSTKMTTLDVCGLTYLMANCGKRLTSIE